MVLDRPAQIVRPHLRSGGRQPGTLIITLAGRRAVALGVMIAALLLVWPDLALA